MQSIGKLHLEVILCGRPGSGQSVKRPISFVVMPIGFEKIIPRLFTYGEPNRGLGRHKLRKDVRNYTEDFKGASRWLCQFFLRQTDGEKNNKPGEGSGLGSEFLFILGVIDRTRATEFAALVCSVVSSSSHNSRSSHKIIRQVFMQFLIVGAVRSSFPQTMG